ncbi:MAG: FAD-binding protein [Thermoanaerobaculia bacterium]
MTGSVVSQLSGWGRYPVEECRVYRPEARREAAQLLASGPERSFVPRGLGRSYGDAAINAGAGVLLTTRLNRLLAFEPSSGVLQCEGGASLASIVETFLPRGWFLPVTPGTRHVTVGGAIAADVHGKNHHRSGTFSRFVLDLTLATSEGGVLACSPEENAESFWATVGGAGLTGFILSARIRLQRVETAWVLADFRRAGDLAEAMALLMETDPNYEYSVAWIDCLARGARLGRSVLMQANAARAADLPRATPPFPLLRPERFAVPDAVPSFVLNPFSVSLFNAAYFRLHPTGERRLVDYGRYFYPLDSVRNWNRLYGRRGFVQYQVVFPLESSGVGLAALLERLCVSGYASFLGVLKRFGEAGPAPLSFPFPGYTLALDLPVRPGLVEFLRETDRLLLDHGGRTYFAKDATTTAESFGRMYPRLEEFRKSKSKLDPRGRLSSSLGRRLGIVS